MISCDQCQKEFETEKQVRMHKLGAHKVQKQTMDKETETKKEKIPNMTPEERAIAERVASQGSTEDWFAIREDEINDFSLMNNPLNITRQNYPEAARMYAEKQYVFRWCTRSPERIDELTRSVRPPLRWMLVTRDSMPPMAKYVDDIKGCVCNLDQALLFKPWAHNEMVKRAKQDLAEGRDRAGTLQGKKEQLQSRGDDIEVFEGKDFRIGAGDEVLADEGALDAAMGVSEDASVGDLVTE